MTVGQLCLEADSSDVTLSVCYFEPDAGLGKNSDLKKERAVYQILMTWSRCGCMFCLHKRRVVKDNECLAVKIFRLYFRKSIDFGETQYIALLIHWQSC